MEDDEDWSMGSCFVFRSAGVEYGSYLRTQNRFELKNPMLLLNNLFMMNRQTLLE